ncbi:hypothetical protein B0A55_04718 [Friedmanniomyces simplex]|uniref:RING-type E3 ubiquitin transferase n=1 Tax=Friedmanniomyces simplex TaxID=329884 RepID=A0A4U0XPS2_9PEZI|nr:hypothetical protein B0A55_04718 [Friedmanniomyces simplex]
MDGGTGTDNNAQLVTDDFKIKGAATRTVSKGKARDAAPDTCTICLEHITERAVAVPCNHLNFDFPCLISWLQERATCPLCKAPVTEVQYDWRNAEDYKTYHVPPKENTATAAARDNQGRRQRPTRRFDGLRAPYNDDGPDMAVEDPVLQRRRRVYRDRTYSLHVGTNSISHHRDFSYQAFAASADLQSQARTFLRRELKVFSFLDATRTRRGGNTREFLTEYVIAVLKVNELKGAGGHAEDLVTEFLRRENARLLLHELEAWLRSPFSRLEAWDEQVQYQHSPREDKAGSVIALEPKEGSTVTGHQLAHFPTFADLPNRLTLSPANDIRHLPPPDVLANLTSPVQASTFSKVLAHTVVTDWIHAHPDTHFEVVRVLPGYVKGANDLIGPDDIESIFISSSEGVLDTALGRIKDEPKPDRHVCLDDVARAHVVALDGKVVRVWHLLTAVANRGIGWTYDDFVDVIERMFPKEIKAGILSPKKGQADWKMGFDVEDTYRALGYEFAGREEIVKNVIEQYLQLKGQAMQ